MPRNPQHIFAQLGQGHVVKLAALGTLACVALSLVINYLLLFTGLTSFGRGVAGALILPVVIGTPLLVFIGLKLQEIRRWRRDLNRAATYDPVTDCFKGSVFSTLVDRRAAPETGQGPRKGAFLLVDAERLRAINMRYGFGWGEEALRLIGATIRAAVRSEDVVGRLGEGEFAIFLPGATEANAHEVAERIKARVAEVVFAPEGGRDLLGVSVGGVTFEGAPGFDAMFRAASQPLSDARESGGVVLSHWTPASGEERRNRPL